MKNPNARHKKLLEFLDELKKGMFDVEDLYNSEQFEDEEKRYLIKKFIEHKDQILKDGEVESDLFITTDPIERASTIRTWGTNESNKKFSPIEDDHFAVVAGQGGAGKTAYTFFLAQENAKSGLVYYFSLEMSSDGILTRLSREHAGITKEQWRDKSLISERQVSAYKKQKKELRGNKNLKLIGYEHKPKIEEILERAKDGSPHLIFIDNLDLIATEEGAKDPQKILVEKIKNFTKKELIPVILVHHLRKSSGKEKYMSGDDLRGSGKIRDNIDTLMLCKRTEFYEDMTEREKAMFIVREDKDRAFGNGGFHTYYFKKGLFVDNLDIGFDTEAARATQKHPEF